MNQNGFAGINWVKVSILMVMAFLSKDVISLLLGPFLGITTDNKGYIVSDFSIFLLLF